MKNLIWKLLQQKLEANS